MDLNCQHSCDQQDKCLNNTSSMFLECTRIPYHHHHHHHHDRCRLAGEGRHKAFLAKSLAQTLQSKSLTDRQTGKKLHIFCLFFGAVRSPSPSKFGTMLRDLEHVIALLKRCVIRRIVSPLGRCAENLKVIRSIHFKPP